MTCERCSSDNQSKFTVEMNFHFPGWEGLTKPTVLAFPEVLVCLECGFAQFSIPEAELHRLASDTGGTWILH
jgi:hypothetical protein